MGKINNYANKPLDKDYFKRKENPNWDKGKKLTECCKQDVDHKVLNVKNEHDWELIENYIQKQLMEYSNTKSITPVACTVCGRLIEYSCVLYDSKRRV